MAAVLALAPLASSCALVERFTGEPRLPRTAEVLPGQIEPVHSAFIVHDQAVFRVTSNGCTTKADILPVVRDSNEGPIITLRRIKEDRCRDAQPDGASLSWSFEELGLPSGSRLSVDNPYQMPPA
jgi:hypothetical protein